MRARDRIAVQLVIADVQFSLDASRSIKSAFCSLRSFQKLRRRKGLHVDRHRITALRRSSEPHYNINSGGRLE